ncbi:peptidylprolyl isomerase [Stigmatella sp. ncwal1]|uniref:Peptidylprolyl isomerase n=1 Tax=Stigmatella ashevillensis TaxID=2995309 RepID=A0ABT5DF06_9BACT|nr:peptidylprolyl isomerase [Stigmatella ashevillena]MDC0712257.1 peptidylprolyl isomerase [Stigmatella ashevillena]
MKFGIVIRCLGLLGPVLLSGCEDPNKVAQVGRTALTREDLAHLRASQSPGVRAELEPALEELVERTLLAEEARRQELQKAPALQARLAAAERELLAHEMLERAVADSVTEQALRARYNEAGSRLERREVHVAHVFARLPEGADETTRRQAQVRIHQVYARLAGGESFEALARELSEDPVSAPRGGDLGVVREGEVDTAFFAQAVGLAEGVWSKPFGTPFGLHVVKALEAPKTVMPPFEAVRGKLEAEARQDARAKLLERLRREISVRRYPERLRPSEDAGTPSHEEASK